MGHSALHSPFCMHVDCITGKPFAPRKFIPGGQVNLSVVKYFMKRTSSWEEIACFRLGVSFSQDFSNFSVNKYSL